MMMQHCHIPRYSLLQRGGGFSFEPRRLSAQGGEVLKFSFCRASPPSFIYESGDLTSSMHGNGETRMEMAWTNIKDI